jgi:hypothetical protein
MALSLPRIWLGTLMSHIGARCGPEQAATSCPTVCRKCGRAIAKGAVGIVVRPYKMHRLTMQAEGPTWGYHSWCWERLLAAALRAETADANHNRGEG